MKSGCRTSRSSPARPSGRQRHSTQSKSFFCSAFHVGATPNHQFKVWHNAGGPRQETGRPYRSQGPPTAGTQGYRKQGGKSSHSLLPGSSLGQGHIATRGALANVQMYTTLRRCPEPQGALEGALSAGRSPQASQQGTNAPHDGATVPAGRGAKKGVTLRRGEREGQRSERSATERDPSWQGKAAGSSDRRQVMRGGKG